MTSRYLDIELSQSVPPIRNEAVHRPGGPARRSPRHLFLRLSSSSRDSVLIAPVLAAWPLGNRTLASDAGLLLSLVMLLQQRRTPDRTMTLLAISPEQGALEEELFDANGRRQGRLGSQ